MHLSNHENISEKVYLGNESVNFFLSCLNSFFDEDSTGKCYVISRDEGTNLNLTGLTGCATEFVADCLSNENLFSRLNIYEMIVIDSGNKHGDSWIATYYPKQMLTTFVDQTK